MQKAIRLGINNPCAENWDRMSPNEKGRFCASCQKTVVDFTSMTDQELQRWFAGPQGSVCGRLRPDQLNRALEAPKEKRLSHWRYWHYVIAGLLFSSEASAQTKQQTPPVSQYLPISPEIRHLIGDTVITKERLPETVRGRVVDNTGKPVEYASVTYGPRQGVSADADGYFSIPADKIVQHQMLTISCIGYNTVHTSVDDVRKNYQIKLPSIPTDEVLAGDVVVVRVKKNRKALTDTVSLFKDTLAAAKLIRPALNIYPNPIVRGATLTVSARLDHGGTYSLQLYSSSGALIESREVDKSNWSGNIALPVPAGVVPGIYFVRLSHPSLAKCYTQEVVVY